VLVAATGYCRFSAKAYSDRTATPCVTKFIVAALLTVRVASATATASTCKQQGFGKDIGGRGRVDG